MISASSLALVALLAVSRAASAGPVEIQWDGAQRYEKLLSVDAGGFTELCGRLAEGARVEWQFEATAPTSFNVHYHHGKEVIFPAKAEGTTRSAGTLEVGTQQAYCWMWSNKAAEPLSVTVRLSRRP